MHWPPTAASESEDVPSNACISRPPSPRAVADEASLRATRFTPPCGPARVAIPSRSQQEPRCGMPASCIGALRLTTTTSTLAWRANTRGRRCAGADLLFPSSSQGSPAWKTRGQADCPFALLPDAPHLVSCCLSQASPGQLGCEVEANAVGCPMPTASTRTITQVRGRVRAFAMAGPISNARPTLFVSCET